MYKNLFTKINRQFYFNLFLSLLFLSPLNVNAQENLSPDQLASALQNNYSKITSFAFNFTQIVRTAGREQQAGGDGVFYRPGLQSPRKGVKDPLTVMRWNYYYPELQIIVNDGTTLSIYSEKDKQMIITPNSELESDITYALLSGSKSILDDFNVSPTTNRFQYSNPKIKTSTVQLVPIKPHPQIKSVYIWFDKSFIIHQLIIEDHFDSITELIFTNFKINSISPGSKTELEKIIHFPVPAETEIINQ